VPRTSAKELATCGICHSRGAKIAEGWRPGQQLLETHVPSLLGPGLFEADGKMVDEVYNYASFRKSKMFKQGVSCSDCHDPHSLELRADGNGVCHQCHDAAKYDAAAHHHHAEGSLAASCPACHMPERTYMVVDPRHDQRLSHPTTGCVAAL
jgi:predicted CXXCH cytochrome family protein